MTPRALTPPLRVLMTADAIGGVWTYGIELAKALAPHGVEFALATMGARPSEAQRAEVSQLPHVRLFSSEHKLEWMEDPWAEVDEAGEWLLELAREFQPDVVHLNGYAHASLPWGAPVFVVAHSCVLSWWAAVKGEGAPAEWEEYRRRVQQGLSAADLVIAPTQAMLSALEEHYAVTGPRRVIPNGRRAALFPPGVKEPVIFSAGRQWDEAKNTALLESIAPRLAWPVHLAGATIQSRNDPVRRGATKPGEGTRPRVLDSAPPPNPAGVPQPMVLPNPEDANARLPSGAAGLNSPGRTHPPESNSPRRSATESQGLGPAHHLGELTPPKLAQRLATASIYAAPARYEPFGLGILEAALAGCALVLSDLRSLRENWEGAAVFVPCDDAEGWTQALNELAADPARRARLAECGRARALRLTPEKCATAYWQAYQTLRAARLSPARSACPV